jgi:serine palmitoyltransferase
MDSSFDEEEALSALTASTRNLFHFLVRSFYRIPGSDILIRYIKNSHQNDPIRTIIEVALVAFLILFITGKTYHPDSNAVTLSEREVDDLVDDWQPEELVKAPSTHEQALIDRIPTIHGAVGARVTVSCPAVLQKPKEVIHLASYNFLDLLGDAQLKEQSIATLRNYGVGACGPPGFYGTQDVHIQMERDIADFLGTEACIVYAQALGTIGSVIPAFAKRGDVLVVDKGVNFAIQKGLQISRCTIKWFNHNDVEDLENVLKQVNKEQSKRGLTRRFIVTEGIFENHGDLVDLPRIIALKQQYKYRLILDESWSIATIGKHGKGVTEHYGIDPRKVDMLVGNLTGSFCSGGGFCAASAEIVDHQRISGASYVFSAALPAMLATQVSGCLLRMKQQPQLFTQLGDLARHFLQQVTYSGGRQGGDIECEAWPGSPLMHLRLATPLADDDEEMHVLQDIVDECLSNGVLVTRAKQVNNDGVKGLGECRPSLRICVTVGHTKKDLDKAASVIRSAFAKVIKASR